MRVRPGVDERGVDFSAERVNRIDKLSFAVVLLKGERHTELTRDVLEILLDVGERFLPVEVGLANPEQIEVRAIQDGDFHSLVSPSSHARKLATSSSDSFPDCPRSATVAASRCSVSCSPELENAAASAVAAR